MSTSYRGLRLDNTIILYPCREYSNYSLKFATYLRTHLPPYKVNI